MMKGAIIIGGYIQGLSNARALGEKGVPVWVIDEENCLAKASRYCKQFVRCMLTYDHKMCQMLLELAQNENLEGWMLFPSDDKGVIFLSEFGVELAKHYRFLSMSIDSLDNIVNKRKLLKIAEQVGTYIPRTCYPENWQEAKEYRYPVMIKGNYGLDFFEVNHKKAYRADTYEELTMLFPKIIKEYKTEEIMVQEMIPFDPKNRVLSFTCFAIDGEIKTYWMGDKLRERPLQFGTATLARSVNIQEVHDNVRDLIKALRFTGVCEVEMMRDIRDGKYKLIEINPRTWMWVGLAKECGVDYAWILYCYLNGIDIEYPTDYETGIKWRNSYTDVVYSIKAMLRGQLTWEEYKESLNGKVIPAVWSSKDMRPGFYYPLLLSVSVIRKICRIVKKKMA